MLWARHSSSLLKFTMVLGFFERKRSHLSDLPVNSNDNFTCLKSDVSQKWCSWDTRILTPIILFIPKWTVAVFSSYKRKLCKVKVKVAQLCLTLCDPMDYTDHGILQNTGVGSCSLLRGIFPTQGSNTGLPHCRRILYQLSHKGSPRILRWVANPFSSWSSWLRNWTGVSCIAGGFFTNWAIGKAH